MTLRYMNEAEMKRISQERRAPAGDGWKHTVYAHKGDEETFAHESYTETIPEGYERCVYCQKGIRYNTQGFVPCRHCWGTGSHKRRTGYL